MALSPARARSVPVVFKGIESLCSALGFLLPALPPPGRGCLCRCPPPGYCSAGATSHPVSLGGLAPFGIMPQDPLQDPTDVPNSTGGVPGSCPPDGGFAASCREWGQRLLRQGCAGACRALATGRGTTGGGHGQGAFTRAAVADGETEARWYWGDLPGICHPLQWPHALFLLPPHSPVPPCSPSQSCCTPRQAALGVQSRRGATEQPHTPSGAGHSAGLRGWHGTGARAVPLGTQLHLGRASQGGGQVGTGAWWGQGVGGQPQPPGTRALHAPAPLPRGTRQPGLCPRPFVWQSAPRAGGSASPAPGVPQSHGLEPLRGSGCGPAASGKDAAGIANGRQPPRAGGTDGGPAAAERAGVRAVGFAPQHHRASPPGSSWLAPQQHMSTIGPWGGTQGAGGGC